MCYLPRSGFGQKVLCSSHMPWVKVSLAWKSDHHGQKEEGETGVSKGLGLALNPRRGKCCEVPISIHGWFQHPSQPLLCVNKTPHKGFQKCKLDQANKNTAQKFFSFLFVLGSCLGMLLLLFYVHGRSVSMEGKHEPRNHSVGHLSVEDVH